MNGTIKENKLNEKDNLSSLFKVRALDENGKSITIPANQFKQSQYQGIASASTNPIDSIIGDWYYAGENGNEIEYLNFELTADYGSKLIFNGLIWEEVKQININSILDMLNADISGLTYLNFKSILEVKTNLFPTLFTWDVKGIHDTLIFSDSYGQIPATSVKGLTEFATSEQYSFDDYKIVKWSINSNIGKSISCSTKWVHRTYYGSSLIEDELTETDVLNGSSLLIDTKSQFSIPFNEANSKWLWVAIHRSQTNRYLSTWYVTPLNQGEIGSENYMSFQNTLNINGEEYDIYMTNYKTELENTLKLN